ncbi:uncharacterized protein LOC112460385 isoform X1 [Temnothorax curvispinosus]|uniref:Uncharacterized protein LOC112460385 isoform X1 n=1 Tax=Temnothorax curvispinosus TaxID=300111 RepID=A0A6J1QEN9_9HYME|nr:uncharacterized protein LOC112460385 isoform X1 [Temnothorax curvispinosus]XP_024880803.1 uncharacterized protein LOC112460385 isoform X1 [Temnothorax curvispinosus]
MQENSNDFTEETCDDMNTFSQGNEDFSTENKENFRWSHEAIMLLLEEYRSRESSMSSGKISQKKVWNEIAAIMNSKGYDVSSRQCMTRINTMKRTYKTIKDHNLRSGNNKRTWKYYDAMESFLGKKRYMSPLTLISSTGKSSFERSKSPSPCSSSSSTCQSDSKVSRKRKAADVMEKITENRRMTEEGKDRRHKERMEMQKKFMEKLDKILDKL